MGSLSLFPADVCKMCFPITRSSRWVSSLRLCLSRFHSVIVYIFFLSRPPDLTTTVVWSFISPMSKALAKRWQREREIEIFETPPSHCVSPSCTQPLSGGNVGRHGNTRAPPVTLTFGKRGIYARFTVILSCAFRTLFRRILL